MKKKNKKREETVAEEMPAKSENNSKVTNVQDTKKPIGESLKSEDKSKPEESKLPEESKQEKAEQKEEAEEQVKQKGAESTGQENESLYSWCCSLWGRAEDHETDCCLEQPFSWLSDHISNVKTKVRESLVQLRVHKLLGIDMQRKQHLKDKLQEKRIKLGEKFIESLTIMNISFDLSESAREKIKILFRDNPQPESTLEREKEEKGKEEKLKSDDDCMISLLKNPVSIFWMKKISLLKYKGWIDAVLKFNKDLGGPGIFNILKKHDCDLTLSTILLHKKFVDRLIELFEHKTKIKQMDWDELYDADQSSEVVEYLLGRGFYSKRFRKFLIYTIVIILSIVLTIFMIITFKEKIQNLEGNLEEPYLMKLEKLLKNNQSKVLNLIWKIDNIKLNFTMAHELDVHLKHKKSRSFSYGISEEMEPFEKIFKKYTQTFTKVDALILPTHGAIYESCGTVLFESLSTRYKIQMNFPGFFPSTSNRQVYYDTPEPINHTYYYKSDWFTSRRKLRQWEPPQNKDDNYWKFRYLIEFNSIRLNNFVVWPCSMRFRGRGA